MAYSGRVVTQKMSVDAADNIGPSRSHLIDYISLFLLVLFLVLSESAHPFSKQIYHGQTADLEIWRYSYPLHVKQQIPAWAVPTISIFGPLVVIGLWGAITRPRRAEIHNTIMACLFAVFVTALVTNLIKLGVGRPRPNFMERCWPDGPVTWDSSGQARCSDKAIDPSEGRKSFPSGHTSWTTSGLGFLSIWSAGKLRCFDGQGQPWRIVVSVIPVGCAIWIGITRLQDYWHHWEDVTVGFLLGITIAYVFYRQQFPPLTSPHAGEHLSASPQPSQGDVLLGNARRTESAAGPPTHIDLETGIGYYDSDHT